MNLISNQANAGGANPYSSANSALIIDPEQINAGGTGLGRAVRFSNVDIKAPPEGFISGRWFTKVYRIQGSASAGGFSFNFDENLSLGQQLFNNEGTVTTTGTAIQSLSESISSTSAFQSSFSKCEIEESANSGDASATLDVIVAPNGRTGGQSAQLSYSTEELFQPIWFYCKITKSDDGLETWEANEKAWHDAGVNDTTSASWFDEPIALEVDSGLSVSLSITAEEHLPIN